MPRQQADTLVTALGDVVEESIKNLERGLVSREEGERWRYSQKVRDHGKPREAKRGRDIGQVFCDADAIHTFLRSL